MDGGQVVAGSAGEDLEQRESLKMKRSLDAVAAKAIEVALELGLFGALGKDGHELESLARRLEVSPRGLRPLLYLLTSLELLTEEAGRFRATESGQAFLREQWPEISAALTPAPEWRQLGQAVRQGVCPGSAIEGEGDGGGFFAQVVPLLFDLHWPMARHLASHLTLEQGRVLDLGAGSAVWSLGLLSQRPHLTGVAVDRAQVLSEVAAPNLERLGVLQRYELRPGNYYEVALEPGAYEVIFLGHLLHSDGLELSRQLLAKCYTALAAGGRLVVAEMVGSQPRGLDYEANLFDLNMLMFTERGLVFTADELEQLGREAGYRVDGWVHGPGRYPVLLLRRDTLEIGPTALPLGRVLQAMTSEDDLLGEMLDG